ncbi:HAMP domain-containing sensor histidine kinase [Devosia sp. MC521]|uniref:sensor histidine kinase n=1 Tax=Devosia sp. MC521 TaxID=2759954 RepID=UPI0015FBA0E1|nr:HAMP domain-containing sensor histidine kinase [Devosia sp. MC521]MBJ6986568.1 HAMP domain-containing histidine kinase [Devosia sp. MC521]QMW61613.1 HAMP domain-containing histidine kinase [Devosia sp. MC521]
MIDRKSPSLGRKLTGKMIVVQLFSLALFFGLGVFPLVIYPIVSQAGSARAIDPSVSSTLAASFAQVQDGEIVIRPSPEVRDLFVNNPDMYVYAVSDSGATLTLGAVPASAEPLIANLSQVTILDLRTKDASGRFFVRTENSSVGPVHVLIGNGPTVSVVGLLRNATILLAFSIWLVLTLVTVIAIPLIVRRELRGVKLLAEDASQINYENRGDRLRETGVPSELLPLVKAVNATLARLDMSYAGRQKFLAAAAHEVRTPIAILQMRLENSDVFPERQNLLLDVARLATLAEQLLEVQRLGIVKGVLAPLDLREIAELVVEEMAPLALKSGYDLGLDMGDAPVTVTGDNRSLHHALANLVQNAIAHSGGAGTILVRVGTDRTISVTDEGEGIPAEARERIFGPFERLHRAGRGTGLGLNLVYSIMHYHGGSVVVSDSDSGGAKFVLRFPEQVQEWPSLSSL